MGLKDIKTWQERLPKDHVATNMERSFARISEISDLRAYAEQLELENAELLKDANITRQIQAIRKTAGKTSLGVPCACEWAEDGETLLRCCSSHRALMEREKQELEAKLKQAAAILQQFKADWMRVPYFADRVNKATREAISTALGPVVNMDAVGMPLDMAVPERTKKG